MALRDIFDYEAELADIKKSLATTATNATNQSEEAFPAATSLLLAATNEGQKQNLVAISSNCVAIEKPDAPKVVATVAIVAGGTNGRKAITEQQARALLAKYPDDRDLWLRFWQYMGEQVDKGATYEYVLTSYANLEQVWNVINCS